MHDLSKDKMVQKNSDSQASQFMKTMENVESGLLEQINYLTLVATSKCTSFKWFNLLTRN